jgi:hypothetical protein
VRRKGHKDMRRITGLAFALLLAAIMLAGSLPAALAQSDAGLTPVTVTNDAEPPTGEVDAGNVTSGGDEVGPAGAIKNPLVRANPRAVQWLNAEGSDLLGRGTISFDCSSGNCGKWRVIVYLCYYNEAGRYSICGNETKIKGSDAPSGSFDQYTLSRGSCAPIANGTSIYFTRVKIQKHMNDGSWDTKITGASEKRSAAYTCPIS